MASGVTISLSYTDADNVAQTQDVTLTVNSNGSYSIASFDLDALPLGNNATGSFTYKVADDSGAESSAQTANITISGTNDSPTLVAGSISQTEDQLESGISVDANSSNLLSGATDVDDLNSSLEISSVEGDSGNVASGVTISLSYTDADNVAQTQDVTLTVNSNGSYSIASFDLDALPLGSDATASFTYKVADDSGAESSAQTANITISGTNDAPTLVAGSISQTEDQLESGISVDANSSNLLSGATDVDDLNSSLEISSVEGDSGNVASGVTISLSYTDADNVAQTQDVTLTVNSNGSYSIASFDLDALPLGNNATGSFTYKVADDSGAESSAQTANITISGTNEAPTISAGSQSVQLVEAGASGAGTDSATITLTTNDVDSTETFDTAQLITDGWSTTDSGITYTKTGTYGTATFTVASGVVSYSLNNSDVDTQSLSENEAVSDSFGNIQVTDGTATDSVAISFAITGADDGTLTATANDITSYENLLNDGNAGNDAYTSQINVTGGAGDIVSATVISSTTNEGTWGVSSTGEVTYTLTGGGDGRIDHTAGNGANTEEDVDTATIQVTDSIGNTDDITISADVVDSIPSNPVTSDSAEANVTKYMQLIVDVSGSIKGDGTGNNNIFTEYKSALQDLIDRADTANIQNVQVITFGGNSIAAVNGSSDGWLSITEAETWADNLSESDIGGGTYYDDAIAVAQSAWTAYAAADADSKIQYPFFLAMVNRQDQEIS